MALLTLDTLRAYTRTQLGEGTVRVELTDDQVDACIQDAVDLLNKYTPNRSLRMLPTNTSGKYNISAIAPDVQEVIDVKATRDTTLGSNLDFDLFNPLLYTAGAAMASGGISSYWQSMESLKIAKRVFNAEVEWYGNWEYDSGTDGPVYFLYVTVPYNSRMQIGFEYLRAITANDDKRTGLQYIHPGMHQWTRRYCVAGAKALLGRVLRKFQGIAGPDGSDFQLDGIDLTTDAEAEKNELEEQIANSRVTLPPLIG